MPNFLGWSVDASSEGVLGLPRAYLSDPYSELNARLVTSFTTPRRAVFRPFGSPARLTFLSKQDGNPIAASEKYTYPGSEEDAREYLDKAFFQSFWGWVQTRLDAGDQIALYVSCPGYVTPETVQKYGPNWWLGMDQKVATRLGCSYRKGGLIIIYDNISIASASEPSPARCVLDAEAATYNGYAIPYIEPTVRASVTSAASRAGVLAFASTYARWVAAESDVSLDPLPKFATTDRKSVV